jgi:antitoxin HicB
VQARELKRALAEQLEESMQDAKLTKLAMARKVATGRSQLDRVLIRQMCPFSWQRLIKAARAVGKKVEIKIKRHKRAA